ncbi:ATPase [Thermogladius sp. 4427co]|uniref:ATPase n=1 Tax=Thermogladius sp. 4427co TaxID=3450718 RepID=UPI003F7ADDB8
MRILVSGLLAYESGKTTLVKGLFEEFLERGLKPGYFKPVAGHNGWYQPDTIENTVTTRLLIGHDAYIVAEIAGLLDKLPFVNPVDILTLPIDPYAEGYSFRSYIDDMSSSIKTTVLARFTSLTSAGISHTYLVIGENIRRLPPVARGIFETVYNVVRGSGVFVETSVRYLEELLDNPLTYLQIDSFLNFFKDYRVLLVEGYNDVAAPTPGSCRSDFAIVVAPTRAALYNGDKYCRAVEVLSPLKPWSVRTVSVAEIVGRPIRIFEIPLVNDSAEFKKSVSNIVDLILRGG